MINWLNQCACIIETFRYGPPLLCSGPMNYISEKINFFLYGMFHYITLRQKENSLVCKMDTIKMCEILKREIPFGHFSGKKKFSYWPNFECSEFPVGLIEFNIKWLIDVTILCNSHFFLYYNSFTLSGSSKLSENSGKIYFF